jgi:hypothetical protein
MNFIETFRVAFEAILSNKVRSGLTMLGVIIGVMAVILLVSIGEGTQVYITKELTGMGTNLLVITPGKTSTRGGFHPPSAGTVRKLTSDRCGPARVRNGKAQIPEHGPGYNDNRYNTGISTGAQSFCGHRKLYCTG